MANIKLKDELLKEAFQRGLPAGETKIGVRVTYEKKGELGSIWLRVGFVLESGEELGEIGAYEICRGESVTIADLRGVFQINVCGA